MSAETEIREALAAGKKADGQRELTQAHFELALLCSDDNITTLLAKIDALRIDSERCKTLFDVAMNTLSQIASTPRNKGARKTAMATELFIQTQSDAAMDQFKKGASA